MDSIFVDTRNGKIVKIITADKVNGLVTLLYIDDKKEKTIEEVEFNQYFSSVEYSNEAHETSQYESNKGSSEKIRKRSKSGNVYYDYETNELVIVDSRGNEVNRLDLTRRGPKGEPGERGSKGEVGDEGPRGPRGDQGDRGERGEQGCRGEIGPQGPKGDQGERGAKGETGAQGERGEKGEQGIKGETGAPGADGDTWQPRLSPDGNSIYFVNSQGDESPRFAIKGERGEKGDSGIPGAKGEKGEQGDTWEPVFTNNNTELFFKNRRTGDVTSSITVKGDTGAQGVQGPQGESAYQIWLNEGHRGDYHDFLIWVAKQADKGEDGEDGDTYVPHVEKGHLFFISQKTGQRIDGGYVIGPEGPRGEAGLNGHNVTHKYGYKEIKDWTCPVQEINPHLIASSDDLASGSSAEAHMRETLNRIKNKRKEGVKVARKNISSNYEILNKIAYFLSNPLKEFFWWCAGADRPLLRMCPAEHSKYMGIGTVIFFTALMAMVSSFFAISYVFGNAELDPSHDKFTVCIVFAIFWGLMIFFLDRFITNTMYSDGKVTISWLELRSALPRILISIFLGIVISAPLELKIFNQEIEDYIKIESQKQFNANLNNRQSPQLSNLYEQCKQDSLSLVRAIKNYEITRGLSGEEKTKRYSKDVTSKKVDKNPISYKDADGITRQGQSTSTSTEHTSVYDEQAYLNALRYDSISVSKAAINDSISRSKLSIAKDSLLNNFNSYDAVKNAGLYERLAALHTIAFHENDPSDPNKYEPWPKDSEEKRAILIGIAVFFILVIVSLPFTSNVTKDSDKQNKKNDGSDKAGDKESHKFFWKDKESYIFFWKGVAVLWPWYAVVAVICGYCNNALFNALPYYIFSSVGMIMMLFILIDVSPVFYKMMLADGQYEQYLHKEKSITQDLIRLNFAKSIAKVNASEIGRLAPLIFSKPYEKIQVFLSDNNDKKELSWTMRDSDGNIIATANEQIKKTNQDLFMTVLGMKQAIIESSYQAWYRDMRDAVMGMHKPGFGNGESGNEEENDNNPPSNPPSPSSSAERETGHQFADDKPFDRTNYYGERTGTSPDYDASSDDPYPGTPEDILKDEDMNLDSHTGNEIGSDEQNQEVDSESISSNGDDELSKKNDE